MVKSGVDLKNYFGLLGTWLKQFGSMTDGDMFSKMMDPWALWNIPGETPGRGAEKGKNADKETGSKEE